MLEARAQIDGPEYEVYLRVGGTPDAIWIDLADSTWRAVRIDVHGWEVAAPPSSVRFRRMRVISLPYSGPL